MKKQDKPIFIESLQMGITDFCNLSCIACGQNAHEGYGHPGGLGPPVFHQGKKGFMSPKLFKKIVQDIIKDKVKFDIFHFYWFGEQLLHPYFTEMLEYLMLSNKGQRWFNRLWINTNATLLFGDRAKILAKAQRWGDSGNGILERLHFSIDAASSSTFSRLKRRNQFEMVQKNCRNFLGLRGNNNWPKLVFGFIIMPENAHEAPQFRDFWAGELNERALPFSVDYNTPDISKGDSIFYKVCYLPIQKEMEELHNRVLQDMNLMEKDQSEPEKTLKRHTDMLIIGDDFQPENKIGQKRSPCPALFRTPTINWDGQLATCCSDYEMENKLPNLEKVAFKKAWFGPQYTRYRKIQLEGAFDKMPRCMACGNLDTLGIKDDEIRALGLESLVQ